MPIFYLHHRYEGGATIDEDGYNRRSLQHMRDEAIWSAREMIAQRAMRGVPTPSSETFEVTDADGQVLFTMRLVDSLNGTMPSRARYWEDEDSEVT